MKHFGDLTLVGGRIRGLQVAVSSDEPLRKGEATGTGSKRIQTISGASGAVACDWSLYDEIRITSTAAITLSFSGALDGQGCILTLIGGNSVTLPAGVRYNSLISSFIPTAGALARDKLGFSYDNADAKYDLVSVIKDIA